VRRPIPAAQGAAAAADRGKREREARGFHPPPYLELGWSVEGGPLGPAGGGGGSSRRRLWSTGRRAGGGSGA
jgi:hypothetical protein